MALFIILTGAAGCGKTTVARSTSSTYPAVLVERFDSIGVPRAEIMRAFGHGCEPGGAWQRAMALQWIGHLEPIVRSGQPILLEGRSGLPS